MNDITPDRLRGTQWMILRDTTDPLGAIAWHRSSGFKTKGPATCITVNPKLLLESLEDQRTQD